MGKFDGMDPTLVRELLAEVKRASGQLRTLEGRVTQLMSGAGLATQTTHRPAQIADACDTMVHDVTARLAVLEKKEPAKDEQPRVDEQSTDATKVSGQNDPKETRDERSNHDNPRSTDDPPKTADDPPKTADDPPKSSDDPPKTADDPPKTGDDVKATDEPKDEPKDEDHDDRRDRGAEPGDAVSDALKPKVIEVDGVKVLQVPLDPPTAEELAELLENIEDVQPVDMPTVDSTPGQVEPNPENPSTDKWANDGSDVVSVDVTPPTAEELRTLVNNVRDIQPLDMPDVRVPAGEWGTGAWAPENIKPDGPAGQVDPGAPVTATDDVSGGQSDDDAKTDAKADAKAGDSRTGNDGAAAGSAGPTAAGAQEWANDGSDVVSVDVKPPTAEALKTLIDNVRDIEPLDMPDVKVPAGEWGKGEWAPEDIKPDGPPGTIEPGERSE